MSLTQVIQQCKYLLDNSPEAECTSSYINDRLAPESREKFMFGYFPEASKIKLLTSLIGEDSLKENKLIYIKEIADSASMRSNIVSYFENYPMVLPYRNVYGEVMGIVGRSILSDDERKQLKISKYKNTVFNKGNHLFGLYESKQDILSSGFAYVVEGQFDVIKAHERGLKNVVALGSSSMTPFQASLIYRYTDTLFIILDNDEAGERGRAKIKDKFGSRLNINNLYLPDGYKDIDEYLSQNNKDSLSFLCHS